MTYMGLFKLTMTSKVRWSPWGAQLSGSASRRPLRTTRGKKQTLAATTTNPSFPAYPLSMVALRSPRFWAWHRVPYPSARGGARGGLGVWRRVPVAALLWESGGRLLDVSRGTTSPPEADLRSWRPEMGQCWSLRVNLAHLTAKGACGRCRRPQPLGEAWHASSVRAPVVWHMSPSLFGGPCGGGYGVLHRR
jgi:hypothetical protein